jgi:hypothetical protein
MLKSSSISAAINSRSFVPPTETSAWRALETHDREIRGVRLRDLFATEPDRAPLAHDSSTNARIRRHPVLKRSGAL